MNIPLSVLSLRVGSVGKHEQPERLRMLVIDPPVGARLQQTPAKSEDNNTAQTWREAMADTKGSGSAAGGAAPDAATNACLCNEPHLCHDGHHPHPSCPEHGHHHPSCHEHVHHPHCHEHGHHPCIIDMGHIEILQPYPCGMDMGGCPVAC